MVLVVAPNLHRQPLPNTVNVECDALCQALARLSGVVRPNLAADVHEQLVRRAVLKAPGGGAWEARRRTGLSDFGDPSFLEPMRRLVEAMDREAQLSDVGRASQRERVASLRMMVQPSAPGTAESSISCGSSRGRSSMRNGAGSDALAA